MNITVAELIERLRGLAPELQTAKVGCRYDSDYAWTEVTGIADVHEYEDDDPDDGEPAGRRVFVRLQGE